MASRSKLNPCTDMSGFLMISLVMGQMNSSGMSSSVMSVMVDDNRAELYHTIYNNNIANREAEGIRLPDTHPHQHQRLRFCLPSSDSKEQECQRVIFVGQQDEISSHLSGFVSFSSLLHHLYRVF
eukprot:scaffold34673_cov175-Amphora_coffeaeformis.AAC.4